MELFALLSKRDNIVAEIKKSLNRYTIYPLKTVEELEDLHANIPLNLLLIDTGSHRLSAVEAFVNKLDNDMAILIVQENPSELEDLPKSVYDCIDEQSISSGLAQIVERAIEKQRLKNELSLLRKTRDDLQQTPVHSVSDSEGFLGSTSFLSRYDSIPGGRDLQEKILVNFAKMLTVSFDMRKFFNHFMDSVKEIARVNKMSVMLKDSEGFYIKTYYGLDPFIAENIRLKKDSPLAAWLARTGKIIHKPVNPVDTALVNIKREMEFLQCSFSFPMVHKGRLIGIFNIDDKITEEPFYKEELEIIYMFCNYLAAAVKDIDLYHQMWYQKEFTKNILSSMNSGMVAIDKDEKITVFNQQASEILNLEVLEMMGKDLRNLPSPLGDILYETMVFGNSYKRYEVEIRPSMMPIGISSFRFTDENQNPVGAGIVFTDLSASKELEEQSRRTEKLEAINDLMAKIAHEVRTPLTSIQTYAQIMSERHNDDEELKNFFSTTVIQSIQNLDSLIDKLIIFSSNPEYNFEKEDANTIFAEVEKYISKNIAKGYKVVVQKLDSPVFVNADRRLLVKAIFYIVLDIVNKTPEGTLITMSAKPIIWGLPSVEISIKYEGSEITEEERQNLLKPLLNINNLGTELNVPIGYKVIEKHKGSLDIKSENGSNIFIIRLPGIERRGSVISIDGNIAEQR